MVLAGTTTCCNASEAADPCVSGLIFPDCTSAAALRCIRPRSWLAKLCDHWFLKQAGCSAREQGGSGSHHSTGWLPIACLFSVSSWPGGLPHSSREGLTWNEGFSGSWAAAEHQPQLQWRPSALNIAQGCFSCKARRRPDPCSHRWPTSDGVCYGSEGFDGRQAPAQRRFLLLAACDLWKVQSLHRRSLVPLQQVHASRRQPSSE